MRSPALVTAIAAAALLVVVVGADLAINRSFAVDVAEDGGWRTLTAHGVERAPPDFDGPRGAVPVDPNGTVEFRLRVANDHPFAYAEPFRVRADGVVVAEGTLEAPAWGEGAAAFGVAGERLLRNAQDRGPTAPAPKEGFAQIVVEVGGEEIFAGFSVREEAS